MKVFAYFRIEVPNLTLLVRSWARRDEGEGARSRETPNITDVERERRGVTRNGPIFEVEM